MAEEGVACMDTSEEPGHPGAASPPLTPPSGAQQSAARNEPGEAAPAPMGGGQGGGGQAAATSVRGLVPESLLVVPDSRDGSYVQVRVLDQPPGAYPCEPIPHTLHLCLFPTEFPDLVIIESWVSCKSVVAILLCERGA